MALSVGCSAAISPASFHDAPPDEEGVLPDPSADRTDGAGLIVLYNVPAPTDGQLIRVLTGVDRETGQEVSRRPIHL